MIIAIFLTLPQDQAQEFSKLQKEIAALTNTTFNTQFPPHITMRSGLDVPQDKLLEVVSSIKEITNNTSFTITLDEIEYTDTSSLGMGYWIGIPLQPNKDLENMFTKLESAYTEYNAFPELKSFTPHISLALNDLDEKGYNKALQFLKDKKFTQTIEHATITLLFSSDRKKWIDQLDDL